MAAKIKTQTEGFKEVVGRFVFQGITDEVTVCDCCGKTGLKSTVVFDVAGDLVHYGSTCAARNTGRKLTVWVSEKKAKDEERRKEIRAIIWNSDEQKAYNAKLAEGHKLKLTAVAGAFRNFVAKEADAFRDYENRVWAESGVSKY